MVFKYRPKKRIRVRKGHRQYITRLQVESVG
jgi:ribosomal protein L21